MERLAGRADVRLRIAQECTVPQRRDRHRGRREVLVRALSRRVRQDAEGARGLGGHRRPAPRALSPQTAVAGLHDVYASPATGAAWIVPKKYVERVGDEGFKKAPVGAGPYKVVGFKPGVELTLEVHEQFWRKTPLVKTLVLRSIPDESVRLAMLKRGEADIGYVFRGALAEELRR